MLRLDGVSLPSQREHDFWIDKKNNLVGVICTQLIPTGTYPQRVLFHNGVYGALEE